MPPIMPTSRYRKGISTTTSSSKSYFKNVISETIAGDFHEGESTGAGTAGSILIGFVPIVGQIADLRDIAATTRRVYQNPGSLATWGQLGVAMICIIPGADVIKLVKLGKKKKTINQAIRMLKNASRKTITGKLIRLVYNKGAYDSIGVIKGRWLPLARFVDNGLAKVNVNFSLEKLIKKLDFESDHWNIYNSRFASKAKDPKHWVYKIAPKGTRRNRFLKGIGNAGWNLFPLPKALNQKIGDKGLLRMLVSRAIGHTFIMEMLWTVEAMRVAVEDENTIETSSEGITYPKGIKLE